MLDKMLWEGGVGIHLYTQCRAVGCCHQIAILVQIEITANWTIQTQLPVQKLLLLLNDLLISQT